MLDAVGFGGDTDTNGCITGALLGRRMVERRVNLAALGIVLPTNGGGRKHRQATSYGFVAC